MLFGQGRRNSCRRSLHLVHCAWFAVFWVSIACAETVRIASWNLASPANFTNSADIASVAGTLSNLDPDVILIQRVYDSNICARLAAALKPAEYVVLTCSSFGPKPNRQLEKQPAADLQSEKQGLESQLQKAKLDLQAAQHDLLTNRNGLGNLANELDA